MSSLKLIEENIKAWMLFYEDSQDPSHIIIEWEDAYGGRPQKPVSRADYEAYRKGERSAYDIVFKAKNGSWPMSMEENEEYYEENGINELLAKIKQNATKRYNNK